MSKVKLKKITLSEAEKQLKESLSLYLINNHKPAIQINLNYTRTNGKTDVVAIPKTQIPLDMSVLSDVRSLIEDPQFRKLIARGSLVLVDTKQSEELIASNPHARKELNRVLSLNNVEGFDDTSEDDDIEIGIDASGLESKDVVDPDGNVDYTALNVSPQVETALIRCEASEEDESSEDILADMQMREDDLEDRDLHALVRYAKRGLLKEWASGVLNERTSGD